MIKVLIADFSISSLNIIKDILESDKNIQVVGTSSNGSELISRIKKAKPDAVLLDLNLPPTDGLETAKIIMQECPVPLIIMASKTDADDEAITAKAKLFGALCIVEKPNQGDHADWQKNNLKFISTIKLMSEIRVVRRNPRFSVLGKKDEKNGLSDRVIPAIKQKVRLILIGASTGGPQALDKIIPQLPATFPVPIVIVQHITSGFTDGLVSWLKNISNINVKIATENTKVEKGCCYISPDGFHTEIDRNLRVRLSSSPPEHGSRPSVSYLFRSVQKEFGADVLAIILSGMGKDGAAELGLIREKGGITIAQDSNSSLIFGMPGEAIKLGSAGYILSAEEIGRFLCNIVV